MKTYVVADYGVTPDAKGLQTDAVQRMLDLSHGDVEQVFCETGTALFGLKEGYTKRVCRRALFFLCPSGAPAGDFFVDMESEKCYNSLNVYVKILFVYIKEHPYEVDFSERAAREIPLLL